MANGVHNTSGESHVLDLEVLRLGRLIGFQEVGCATPPELIPVATARPGPDRPDLATSRRPRLMLRDLFPLGVVFGICGPVAIAGSVYVLTTGSHRILFGVASPCFFVMMASTSLYVAALYYSKLRVWHRRVVSVMSTSRHSPPFSFHAKKARRFAAAFAVLACTLGTTAAIGAAPATAADCGYHSDYTGGDWVGPYMCGDQVRGSAGFFHSEIWLDRADYGPNPTQWAGQVTLHRNDSITDYQSRGSHWWRTCFRDNGGPIYCSRWYA
jgi:hypothetical protein